MSPRILLLIALPVLAAAVAWRSRSVRVQLAVLLGTALIIIGSTIAVIFGSHSDFVYTYGSV
jgi:hypothetical protein